MSKKITFSIITVVALLILAAIFALATRSAAWQPTTTAKAKSNTASAPACLQEDKHISIDVANRTALEQELVMQLTDVPAGTNTTISFASYNEKRATGTEAYPKKYGSYNFVAEKVDSVWRVTSFTFCK